MDEAQDRNPNSATKDCPSFEHSLAELEAIVHDLEDGQLGLAEALARYEVGVKHLKHCYTLLAQAEQKIELLTAVNEEGEPVTEPFLDPEAAPSKAAVRRRPRTKPPAASTSGELPDLAHDIDD